MTETLGKKMKQIHCNEYISDPLYWPTSVLDYYQWFNIEKTMGKFAMNKRNLHPYIDMFR